MTRTQPGSRRGAPLAGCRRVRVALVLVVIAVAYRTLRTGVNLWRG